MRRLRILALLACLALPGCYVLEAARGQLDLNARRVPVATLLAAPGTDPALRRQLEVATRIRDFASAALGLPDNASYRSYADLGRPYVVWNVFATPEFAVQPRTWCFPVAGCVAYRGYFDERRARGFALALEARGDDVAIGGVPAYSTLGHFADPLLSTMLRWDEVELAALVFHELAHQRLYVGGDTAFNEAFATVVEREGVRRWLEADGRGALLADYQAREARYARVAALVAGARARLRALYAQPLPAPELRAGKAAEFERLAAEYRSRREELGSGFDWLFGPGLNNARLLAVATYQDCVPGLAARLAAVEGDLGKFYAEARALARASRAARHAAVCAAPRVSDPSSVPTPPPP
ncbi:MAG: aminopeptidase [Proteobacteria bacterium]|nr:aminopeptidase [Pseudomonadota bacterium]